MDEKAVKSMEEIAGSLLGAGLEYDFGGSDPGYYDDSYACAAGPATAGRPFLKPGLRSVETK
jgi:hypothetical protein